MMIIQLLLSLVMANGADVSAFQHIPVQDAGREKPFDTFAKESLQLIYGKSQYRNNKGEKVGATEVVMTWLLFPQVWQDSQIIEITNSNIKEALQLEEGQKHYSLGELSTNKRIPTFFQELNIRLEGNEKLNVFFLGIQRISNQMSVFSAILNGSIPGFIPKEGGWVPLDSMGPKEQERFAPVANAFMKIVSGQEVNLDQAIDPYLSWVYEKTSPSLKQKIEAEVHYNRWMPFEWVWIILVIALVFYALNFVLQKKLFLRLCFALNILAFLAATYGFILRVYLTGRPPVSNMYETVIWVAWGTLLFTIILYLWKRNHYLLLASSLMAGLCFMVADFAPNVLDPSLQPLEPVLRSNLWLTIHVLTITLSYAAFLLSFGLSDVGLFYYLRPGPDVKKKIRSLSDASYRAIQIGIVLLAAGTILGGVWADYSWGRFWGWDPKETWALIALLGYLVILHARLGGLVRNFGMFVGSIIAFSLVIMAWYGVNFVLGAGLHSYGFGGGGIEYVSGFVFIHILYVIFVYMNKKVNV